jgi:hypothetical protein
VSARCPSCDGPQLLADPAGLRYQHAQDCALLPAEDSRHVADLDALAAAGPFDRPATAAEAVLLEALGADPVPTTTTVRRVTASIVHRSWRRNGLTLDLDTGEWTTDGQEA